MDALDPAEAVVPICFSCYLCLLFSFLFHQAFWCCFSGVRIWGLGKAGKNGLRGMGWNLGPLYYPLDGGSSRELMQFMCILHGACCSVAGDVSIGFIQGRIICRSTALVGIIDG